MIAEVSPTQYPCHVAAAMGLLQQLTMHGQHSLLLSERLAQALPKDIHFIVHHVSTPPTPCPAIYSAPPGKKPEKTFCETQFLSVSVPSDGAQIQVFGLEILIYTTKYLTTLFVSKADSTGYLYLLNLPEGTPSPLKTISSTFLKYLIEQRQRTDTRLVLSLFARAQNQYLFPGSVENRHKHVLDDRRLIKWWCQVLDTVLDPGALLPSLDAASKGTDSQNDNDAVPAHGFLRVPGCDKYETAAFFPKHVQILPGSLQQRWTAADPLHRLGRDPNLPERCLIPRFPDDPKSRFLIDLDDELPDLENELQGVLSKADNDGRWQSVRSLEQFWDMMSFRQECSAGRLVGFIWGVFTPRGVDETLDTYTFSDSSSCQSSPSKTSVQPTLPTPVQSQARDSQSLRSETPLRSSPLRDTQAPLSPSTPIRPATNETQLSIKSPFTTQSPEKQIMSNHASPTKVLLVGDIPEKTKYYYWPIAGRGEIVIREKSYQRMNKLLLKLDYANEEIAKKSSEKWLKEVAAVAKRDKWGELAVGQKEVTQAISDAAQPAATTLNMGLVKKKKKRPHGEGELVVTDQSSNGTDDKLPGTDGANVLDPGHVRKKAKQDNGEV